MPTSENPVLTFLDSETSGCFADHFVRDGSVVTWLPLKRAASCWSRVISASSFHAWLWRAPSCWPVINSYHSTNNSQVDAYASALTQMVIDISSYFAP